MKDMNNMKNAMSAVQFAMWELHLYLDTHPQDLSALKMYNKYEEKYEAMLKEYESKYGPLYSSRGTPGVSWLKNPWPWDYEGGCN